MTENKGIAGDEKLRLKGIRAYIDQERGLVFVENEKRKEWLLSCPHCDAVYWYTLGQSFGPEMPQACRDAICPPTICETCKKPISYDRPFSDHDHAAHDTEAHVG